MKVKNRNIFITATNTDVGKTYITEQLIYNYSLFGFRVGVIKPIETGVIEKPLDGTRLLNKAMEYNKKLHKLHMSDIVPYQFELPASPFVAKANTKISISKIKDAIKKMESYCDILLIEGAGGLLVPIEKNYFMIDLIKELNCKTLLVAPSNLGSINDTLLSIGKLQDYKIDFDWVINLHKDIESFSKVTEPFYKQHFKNFKIFQNNAVQLANGLIYK